VHDHFLDLGGDSIRATQIIARVINQYGLELSHQKLLQSPTIAEMAKLIAQYQMERIDVQVLEKYVRELEED
jgi:acyl carrier protein